MKRTATLLLLIAACWHTLCAQNTVESIRQRYTVIKNDISNMMMEDGFPPEYYEVKVVQNLPATGDSENFQNEYTGNCTPKTYESLYSQYVQTANRTKKLFEATEASTHI